MASDETYEATIKALTERRNRLTAEAEALDQAISILASAGLATGSNYEKVTVSTGRVAQGSPGVYSLLSMRWACLWILSQAGKVGLSTASVAELLERGGRISRAERFASSVSAVLSNMKMKGEVEPIGNYWVLTQLGHAALKAILPRLKILADQHFKYTEEDIKSMPLSKSRALLDAKDADYAAACDYYFGGAAAIPNELH